GSDAPDQGRDPGHADRHRQRAFDVERPRAFSCRGRRQRPEQAVPARRPHLHGAVAGGCEVKDLTGTRLGQYEIVERLGGGGMAVVYRAVQQPLGREVALKALSSELFQDEGFVKRFETEAKTLAKLDHPNILPIYDFEVMDGNTFLTMPLIRGGTLRDVLNRGPLDALTAWRYLREIGDGLQHAHDAGRGCHLAAGRGGQSCGRGSGAASPGDRVQRTRARHDVDEDRRRSSTRVAAGDHPRFSDPDADRRPRFDDPDPRAHGRAARE